MHELEASIDALAAESNFSGVVRVDLGGDVAVAKAYGLAHRAHGIAITIGTRFGVASAVKGFTALAVVGLVADGVLTFDTPARALLGSDLPLIADDVTVEHLLAHRSGIGDYFDEDVLTDIDAYVLPVGAHELVATEDYVQVLDGFPTKFPAGERFSYCNGGYVVLALLAERAAGVAFADLVRDRVTGPAGMHDTAFLRSDELPGSAALGYLRDGTRTNVFHLPVIGSGDGGSYSTVADLQAFWKALFAGAIVPTEWVEQMIAPRSDVPSESKRYGLGFCLHESRDVVMLEGYDAGVSANTLHDPAHDTTFTVLANTSEGAAPMVRHVTAALSLR